MKITPFVYVVKLVKETIFNTGKQAPNIMFNLARLNSIILKVSSWNYYFPSLPNSSMILSTTTNYFPNEMEKRVLSGDLLGLLGRNFAGYWAGWVPGAKSFPSSIVKFRFKTEI
jgi:hypothetical protein